MDLQSGMARVLLFLAVFVVAISGCGEDDMELAPDGSVADAGADAGAAGASLGLFDFTYYWLALESDASGPANTNLSDDACNVLATVSAEFADSLTLEGSGKLNDGRVLNYFGSCSCPSSPCFFEVPPDKPWGVGTENRTLVPFRSVAVDRNVIAIGTSLYVSELDGLLMPGDPPTGGFVHDGCLLADDVGGAIGGQRIDFFSGLRTSYVALISSFPGMNVDVRAGGQRCP
jgi:3D (Asp-Asp-Asp) domain-containing protein